jgi:hypothetical protein
LVGRIVAQNVVEDFVRYGLRHGESPEDRQQPEVARKYKAIQEQAQRRGRVAVVAMKRHETGKRTKNVGETSLRTILCLNGSGRCLNHSSRSSPVSWRPR